MRSTECRSSLYMHHPVSEIDSLIHSVSLASHVSTHFIIHLSAHLCHHHHSRHPSRLHSLTPSSKPTFSTKPSHLNTSTSGLPSRSRYRTGLIMSYMAPPYLSELCRQTCNIKGRRHLRWATRGDHDVSRCRLSHQHTADGPSLAPAWQHRTRPDRLKKQYIHSSLLNHLGVY